MVGRACDLLFFLQGPVGSEASIFGLQPASSEKFREQFCEVMETNVLGPLTCMKLAMEVCVFL